MIPDQSYAVVAEEEPAIAGFLMPEEKHRLSKYIDSDNVAELLDEEDLKKIGTRCLEGYDVDDNSRKEWLTRTETALELASQVVEEKTFPWRGAANIKIPLITEAAIKFAARAYSEIIKDNRVVKSEIVGEDPQGMKAQRGKRVSNYMSWQLTEKEAEWEADTDKLLHVLPIVGHLFRKRHYCPAEKRTKSELCMPDTVCVNAKTSSLESARRVTHIIKNVHQNDVTSNQRAGIWLNVELREKKTDEQFAEGEEYDFLEQHCYLDLDDDGYEEPYAVTIEKESAKVLRIVAMYDEDSILENDRGEIVSIKPKSCFTDYIFLPSMDGGYYGTGYGQLIGPLNESANSIINRLLDAGTLANVSGGFLAKQVKLIGGRQRFEIGEWKRTTANAQELYHGVVPLPTKEPSATLFNLLGLIMDLTKDISSVKDVLSGESPGMNVPATTIMALIEQGMKTFNAIYKRIYRSLTKEYKQLYKLNYEYMDAEEYFTVLDEQQIAFRQDFELDSMDVKPIANPNLSTDMQRLAQAEALKQGIGLPGVDPRPIIKLWLEALNLPETLIDQILPEQQEQEASPQVLQMMHEAELKTAELENKDQDLARKERELDLKEREFEVKQREFEVKAVETVSKAVKNFADAESSEAGIQINAYKALADKVLESFKVSKEIPQQPIG